LIATIGDRQTLADLLQTAAEAYPDKGLSFVQPVGQTRFTSYSDLLSQAKMIASGMAAKGMKPGDKAMIVMTHNEDIVNALWACLISGIVPTILQPPVSFSEFNTPAQKIENVYHILEKPWIILSSDLIRTFQNDVFSPEKIINIETLKINENSDFKVHKGATDDLAFIQFSSGSTGDPKGIMLTHRNILTNIAAICVGLDIHDTDVMANWMPLYHDMGLFGFHMTPVFAKSNHYLIDPVDFIKRPTIWLETIDQSKSTITGCPNFGQALLLRYLKNKEEREYNLSSLKAIVNGAEPISNRIMSEFMNRLSVYSLRKESMMPAYGMAETTLAISFFPLQQEPVVMTFNRTVLQKEGKAVRELKKATDMIELVSVGKALNDIEIRILDESGRLLEEGNEGHIQIRGAGVTGGYYNNPEATRDSFDENWLKTGDKGFFFDGHLYITGRVKDIIFVHGQNLYAHDLENLASKHADIPYGKVIVGGVFDPKKGKDQIILFLVGSPNQLISNMFQDLKGFFRDTYGINVDVFVPVRSNQVPKTSSGKIQRYKLLDDYRDGVFDEAIAEIRRLGL
jgi:acyl-CoA synthetase (AMP-forming)/AMP-acid ligase II